MADPAKNSPSAAPANTGVAQPVPQTGNGGQAQTPPAAASAKSLAVKHAGNSGGRKREDGLVPGSKEAVEADRKKDRERKQITRAQASASVPPPTLPPVNPSAAPLPGAPGDVVPQDNFIPWQAEMLKPLTDQLIDGAEDMTAGQIKSKAVKARLPGEIVKEISQQAEWNKPAKNMVKITLPRVGAKWMNKTRISAEYQDEVALGTALLTLAGGHMMLMKRMDELIRKANAAAPATPKPAEEKKP